MDAWYTGNHPAHLDTCDLCAERAVEVSRWLEHTRELGVAEADAAFPAERLAAQQSQILHKLEQLDRPAKLLSFPRMSPAVSAHGTLAGHGHLVSSRWIAAAAAAGLILGVVGGRLSTWQPARTAARTASVPAAPASKAVEPARADDTADLLMNPELAQPQIHSLSAIDSLTPQVTVARVSTQRR